METTVTKCLTTKANDVTSEGIVTVAVNGIGIEDVQHDISMPGSFKNTLKNNIGRMRWLYNHDMTQLLGVPISGEETAEDVIMVGKINTKKQLGRDVLSDYELYAENGRTLEHSIGVQAVKRNPANKKEVLEWNMMEYSTLSCWGANPRTHLIGIKSDRQQIEERAAFIRKALQHHGYSDERLAKYDMELNLLLKSLDGQTIVKCKRCGHEFAYDEVDEVTATTEVRDMACNYVHWAAEGVVRQHVDSMKPEIRAEVLAILDTFKGEKSQLDEKSLMSLLTFVRCPECWARVYRSDSILEEPVEKAAKDPKGDVIDDKVDENDQNRDTDTEDEKKKSFWNGLNSIFTK